MRSLLLPLMLLLFLPMVNAHASHEVKCKPPYTKLYVYTFPPETECAILKHTNTLALNKSSIEYNAGVAAGEKNSQGVNFTSWLCPPGHTKEFCRGFAQTSCSSEGCNGDFTCVNPNQPPVDGRDVISHIM